jgi:hypothetical protein
MDGGHLNMGYLKVHEGDGAASARLLVRGNTPSYNKAYLDDLAVNCRAISGQPKDLSRLLRWRDTPTILTREISGDRH